MTNELQTKPTENNLDQTGRMSVSALIDQVNFIHEVANKVMRDGEHYGVIPGCGKEKTLLKPGAELLCTTFQMAPQYQITTDDLGNGHRNYQIICTLISKSTGKILGSGIGCCSTMESKFRYRDDKKKCPLCSAEAIIKGKEEFGGGWLCYTKKNGCGTKFLEDDKRITEQKTGKMENQDIADTYNTVLKIAKKRALVDGVLTVTSASDIFDQDMEEIREIKKPSVSSRVFVPKSENVDSGELVNEKPVIYHVPEEMENDAIEPQEEILPLDTILKDESIKPAKSGWTKKEGCISEPQGKRFFAIAKSKGKTNVDIKTYLHSIGIEHTHDMPWQAYNAACEWAEKPLLG